MPTSEFAGAEKPTEGFTIAFKLPISINDFRNLYLDIVKFMNEKVFNKLLVAARKARAHAKCCEKCKFNLVIFLNYDGRAHRSVDSSDRQHQKKVGEHMLRGKCFLPQVSGPFCSGFGD